MAFTLTRRVNFTGTANPGGKRDAFGEEPGDEEDGAAAEGAATQGPFHSGSMERQQTRPGGQLMRYALEGARSDEDEDGDDVLGEGQPAAASLLGGPALGTAAAAVGSPRGVPRLDLGKGEAVRGGRGDSHQGPQSNRSDSSQGGPRSARLSAFRQGSHNASFRMVRSSAFFAAAMVHREDDSIHPDYRARMDSLPGMPRTRNASVEEYEARLSAKKDVESSLKQWAERVLAGRGNEVGEYVDAELLELDNSRADLSPQPVGLSASIRSWFMAMVAEEVERRHDAAKEAWDKNVQQTQQYIAELKGDLAEAMEENARLQEELAAAGAVVKSVKAAAAKPPAGASPFSSGGPMSERSSAALKAEASKGVPGISTPEAELKALKARLVAAMAEIDQLKAAAAVQADITTAGVAYSPDEDGGGSKGGKKGKKGAKGKEVEALKGEVKQLRAALARETADLKQQLQVNNDAMAKSKAEAEKLRENLKREMESSAKVRAEVADATRFAKLAETEARLAVSEREVERLQRVAKAREEEVAELQKKLGMAKGASEEAKGALARRELEATVKEMAERFKTAVKDAKFQERLIKAKDEEIAKLRQQLRGGKVASSWQSGVRQLRASSDDQAIGTSSADNMPQPPSMRSASVGMGGRKASLINIGEQVMALGQAPAPRSSSLPQDDMPAGSAALPPLSPNLSPGASAGRKSLRDEARGSTDEGAAAPLGNSGGPAAAPGDAAQAAAMQQARQEAEALQIRLAQEQLRAQEAQQREQEAAYKLLRREEEVAALQAELEEVKHKLAAAAQAAAVASAHARHHSGTCQQPSAAVGSSMESEVEEGQGMHPSRPASATLPPALPQQRPPSAAPRGAGFMAASRQPQSSTAAAVPSIRLPSLPSPKAPSPPSTSSSMSSLPFRDASMAEALAAAAVPSATIQRHHSAAARPITAPAHASASASAGATAASSLTHVTRDVGSAELPSAAGDHPEEVVPSRAQASMAAFAAPQRPSTAKPASRIDMASSASLPDAPKQEPAQQGGSLRAGQRQQGAAQLQPQLQRLGGGQPPAKAARPKTSGGPPTWGDSSYEPHTSAAMPFMRVRNVVANPQKGLPLPPWQAADRVQQATEDGARSRSPSPPREQQGKAVHVTASVQQYTLGLTAPMRSLVLQNGVPRMTGGSLQQYVDLDALLVRELSAQVKALQAQMEGMQAEQDNVARALAASEQIRAELVAEVQSSRAALDIAISGGKAPTQRR